MGIAGMRHLLPLLTGIPSALSVFTVWHAYCFVYDPDGRYTDNSILPDEPKMKSMTKTIGILISLAFSK